ncbi:hypothetical protein TBLA_0D05670 [Henningerozyma blattae CBS 6284]|uniref:Mitochondrial thiamine pyrophosphate carrier 1 n=1 Tax=Henningerozyma blattae (strain ATCC 34711 / CBS 6284 / DSM 70876 / NBRC 10599 / NRRL Y-10934 / UCD 77-7) TaxID=1071380 RepID=I2H3V7_HENB6|nr:hypothetical protein TBLA_0D05670 [Tetrapisispora blattae CBS 6284]CCH61059.1 hypothetical protein TBLA_0D05670 [Tetrapisispora blattae CBS 6284]
MATTKEGNPTDYLAHMSELDSPVEVEDYESMPSTAPLSSQLMAGAFAGIMEHMVMFPVDSLKTRIQSSSSPLKLMSSNISTQLKNIIHTQGYLAPWKGVQAILVGAGPAHAIYFATYEACKSRLIKENDTGYHPFKIALCGATATTVSDFLFNPFDTVKQRLQLNYNGRIWNMTKTIYQNEGLAAFYYSYPTTIAMDIPFAAFNFVIYESTTKFFNPTNSYNPFIHCLCGGISGATCAAITTPLDCIKTILQVRGSETLGSGQLKKASTMTEAAKAIYSVRGWKGFVRGMKPRVIANMPATAISWTAYECAKHFLMRGSTTPEEESLV